MRVGEEKISTAKMTTEETFSFGHGQPHNYIWRLDRGQEETEFFLIR